MSDKLISVNNLLKHTVLAGEIMNPYMEVVPAYFAREAPAVDAVEVVRCSQCRHLKEINKHKIYALCEKTYSAFWAYEVDTRTHFCGFGERREENAVD